MKKLFFALQLPLFLAFNFFVFTAVLDVTSTDTFSSADDRSGPVYNGKEEFDPSLTRLNTVKKLEAYCDSIYAFKSATGEVREFEEAYPEIVVSAVRQRFFHGYSKFSFTNNYSALLFEPLTGKSMSAIVLPDDILKYPYGACSQQSIVVMDILRKKGLITRAVNFNGVTTGHFSFETFYNGTWHYFDPNLEPDQAVLDKYHQPGIAFLASNPAILTAAYNKMPAAMAMDIFPTYRYGKPNAALAPWASFYQKTTKFLSYTLWIFFLMAFIWVRRKYRRISSLQHVRNSRVFIPQLQTGASPSFNIGYQA